MEGPSLIILREECNHFSGKKILNAFGNSKTIDIPSLVGKTVIRFDSWGKHFLIVFKNRFLRIHFLMFGSYRINEDKPASPRLSLVFKNGVFQFYSCSVQMIEGSPDDLYDREVDLLSPKWNMEKVLSMIKNKREELVADVILDQTIFAGAGNIIKNEVLYRLKLHPDTLIKNLSLREKKSLVKEVQLYCIDFYKWKKKYELRKHWIVYKQRTCKSCKAEIYSMITGKLKRRSYFCSVEQKIKMKKSYPK